MSYRGRRSRRTHLNSKDSTNQVVQDVVSQVIQNIAANEEQDADNIRSYLSNYGDDAAATQATNATTTEANDMRSLERTAGRRQSLTPPPSQVLTSDSQQSRGLQRRSLRVVTSDDKADQVVASGGNQAEETRDDPGDDIWMNGCSMIEPQATDAEISDIRPKKINGAGRQSLTPPSSQPLATDPQQSSVLRTSSLVQRLVDQANHGVASGGANAEEIELGSCGNMWTNDASVTKRTEGKATETNDLGPSQENTVEKHSRMVPPSRSLPTDSLGQLNSLQRLLRRVQENDGEPALCGLSEAQNSKPSKRVNDREFDDIEEMQFDDTEEVESDAEPAHCGLSQARRPKPSNWSNDIHFDEMEEVEMRDSEGKRGKKGGVIMPRHVWSLRSGVRFVVPFNSLGQPVRKGGFVLIRFLGDVAKVGEVCPIGATSWHKVDKSYKAKVIALVREKFVLPDGLEIDKHILKHVGKAWRNYRHSLKSDYKKPGKTQEQVASIVPSGVVPSQWVKLVEYWFSDKCKIYSQIGKAARSAQLHIHTSGSKSFARRRDEFEKVHGREPGALEWFRKTHERKDGTFIEEASKEFVETAEALISQRDSTSSPKKRIEVENQVFNELMYSDDEIFCQRPVGYGFGVTKDKVFGIEAELRKRGFSEPAIEAQMDWLKRKRIRVATENSSYLRPESSKEVKRLNLAMISMGETSDLMRGQIKMQSEQLQMQSQQLRNQSKQIERLQVQLEQVTSLLMKFGSKLKNPQINHMHKGVLFQGVSSVNRRVPINSSELCGSESESSEWESD